MEANETLWLNPLQMIELCVVKKQPQRIVIVYDSVCQRRYLKINIGKGIFFFFFFIGKGKDTVLRVTLMVRNRKWYINVNNRCMSWMSTTKGS